MCETYEDKNISCAIIGRIEQAGKNIELKETIEKIIHTFISKYKVTVFYYCMTKDLSCGEFLIGLFNKYKDHELKLNAVIPYNELCSKFCDGDKKRYNYILSKCNRIYDVHEPYYSRCYLVKKQFMMIHSKYIIIVQDKPDTAIEFSKELPNRVIALINPTNLEIEITLT